MCCRTRYTTLQAVCGCLHICAVLVCVLHQSHWSRPHLHPAPEPPEPPLSAAVSTSEQLWMQSCTPSCTQPSRLSCTSVPYHPAPEMSALELFSGPSVSLRVPEWSVPELSPGPSVSPRAPEPSESSKLPTFHCQACRETFSNLCNVKAHEKAHICQVNFWTEGPALEPFSGPDWSELYSMPNFLDH